MTPDALARLEKLAAIGVRILPLGGIQSHFVLERGQCAVLVERRGMDFGAVGNPGLLTGSGFAVLVERPDGPWFVGKGAQLRASPEQAAAARKLFTDLKSALS